MNGLKLRGVIISSSNNCKTKAPIKVWKSVYWKIFWIVSNWLYAGTDVFNEIHFYICNKCLVVLQFSSDKYKKTWRYFLPWGLRSIDCRQENYLANNCVHVINHGGKLHCHVLRHIHPLPNLLKSFPELQNQNSIRLVELNFINFVIFLFLLVLNALYVYFWLLDSLLFTRMVNI